MNLLRYASKFGSLLRQFADRKVIQCGAVPAGTFDGGFDARWENNLGSRNYKATASGAKWAAQPEGHWKLLKADDGKKKAAVRDLLQHLRFPCRELIVHGEHECVFVDRLTPLVEQGFSLPTEYLLGTQKPECAHCDFSGGANTPKNGGEPKNRNGKEQGNDSHRI